jgi:hypothetical protein
MHAFGQHKYPREYDPPTGIVRNLTCRDKLKQEIGLIDARRQKDPHIAFFAAKNPGYQNGNELLCLTAIAMDNITPACRRFFTPDAEPC